MWDLCWALLALCLIPVPAQTQAAHIHEAQKPPRTKRLKSVQRPSAPRPSLPRPSNRSLPRPSNPSLVVDFDDDEADAMVTALTEDAPWNRKWYASRVESLGPALAIPPHQERGTQQTRALH